MPQKIPPDLTFNPNINNRIRQGHRMILFDSAEFDEGEAARLMTTHWQRGDREVERRP